MAYAPIYHMLHEQTVPWCLVKCKCPPAGPAGCCPLNFLILINLKFCLIGRTKVFYATSLVLIGAKAKFLKRKPSVLVALEEISETC